MNPNHSYDSIKVILLVLIVILVGYFVFTNTANRNVGEEGQVYKSANLGTVGAAKCTASCPWGGTCSGLMQGSTCVCDTTCSSTAINPNGGNLGN